MVCEIEWILASDALLNELDKLITLGFGERSVKGKLSKFEIYARLERAPGFRDFGDRNRLESVFPIVLKSLNLDTTATVRVILSAYIVDSMSGHCLRS